VKALTIWLCSAYVLWVMFLAVMALRWTWRELPGITRALAVPAVIIAELLDVGFNLAATIPFLDWPREATFSQRMGRYKRESGLRSKIARWVCANLLDPFEVGGHCR